MARTPKKLCFGAPLIPPLSPSCPKRLCQTAYAYFRLARWGGSLVESATTDFEFGCFCSFPPRSFPDRLTLLLLVRSFLQHPSSVSPALCMQRARANPAHIVQNSWPAAAEGKSSGSEIETRTPSARIPRFGLAELVAQAGSATEPVLSLALPGPKQNQRTNSATLRPKKVKGDSGHSPGQQRAQKKP